MIDKMTVDEMTVDESTMCPQWNWFNLDEKCLHLKERVGSNLFLVAPKTQSGTNPSIK